MNALHWPGAVGMFLGLDENAYKGTHYYAAPSFQNGVRGGCWQGWATNGADALDKALRVAAGVLSKHGVALTIGEPVKLTVGETAAVITGADVRGFLP
jgi:hypothetical protein